MLARNSSNHSVAGVLTILLSCSVVLAQVDNFLEEDSSAETKQEDLGTSDGDDANEGNLDLSILFKKVSELENENRFLNGRIEQLENELETIRRENRDRYSALEERLRELTGQTGLQAGGTDRLTPDQSTEDGMYQQAVIHIEEQEYEAAISVLNEMIESYPNGKHVPMGFYYLGELYRTKDPKELEEARQNFVQLIRLHPEHAKIAEAKYKLGTIYDQLGDSPKALEYLDEVVQEHPGTSASRLAKEYAATMREAESTTETTD